MGVEVVTIAASLTVSVPEEVVETQVGYLPWVLGENLAGQVDTWVMEERTGYYPALDFFREQPEAVDPALLHLIDEVATFCAAYARRELRRRLSRVFSNVQIEQLQCTAYTMPKMRPNRSNGPMELAQHYAPDKLKMELLLSSIQKARFEGEERMALDKVSRFAREPFSTFQLNGAKLLEG
ncbi:MAG: hypothetical protein OEZ16_06645 [Chromatiales bacterium]|nr:hypothetical protein [Chromatiales bacterium]